MALSKYYKKRNFTKTSEPKGKVSTKKSNLFVIQKHKARNLHYDFRIEIQGVLKSWAVPKGLCLDPKVKRLAVHVEDHPIEYGSFEGIIPKGQYGGGTVMLWDKGTWEPLDNNPKQAYEKGHLRFYLHGKKLHGRWDLIRFKKEENNWFLVKYNDEYAKPQNEYDITKELPKSVTSKHTIDEIAQHYDKIWDCNKTQNVKPKKKSKLKNIKSIKENPAIELPKGLKKTPSPKFIAPQLATLVDTPPTGTDWLHEIKFDGYRILAFKNGAEVILKSRNNKDWTHKLQLISDAIKKLPFEQLIIDGEVVVLDVDGRSDFQLLQNTLKHKQQAPFVYFLFDILYFEGYDLRKLPLIERKSILKDILSVDISSLYYSDHIIGKGKSLYEHSCDHALEGIISKRLNSTYHSKRTMDWLKVKCLNRQEFVIGGYTPPQGQRAHFGSLFLGANNTDGTLEFVGNVGTGFKKDTLNEVYKLLTKNKTPYNPFNSKPPGSIHAHWVKPKLVCEVEFTEWTEKGRLRHPSFKGMRLDKKATDVMLEFKTPIHAVKNKRPFDKIHACKNINIPMKNTNSDFHITNPDKVLYPEDNITKQDILNYYESVSDLILPYLAFRPITIVRCPSHYDDCFYQRHYNKKRSKALYFIADPLDKKNKKYIYIKDKDGLLELVQMGVLEIHPWASTTKHLEKPDIMVFDLDPAPEVPWSKVVASAKEVRDYLKEYQLTSFVKTTGGKGLHVVVPILPEYNWQEVKDFTHAFVQVLEKLKPDEYITTVTKAKRSGKIFIDYLRNQRTATAIGAYSTRARLHAPVSTPLSWDELDDDKEKNSFNINTLAQRLAKLKEDPWSEFWYIKQSLRL